MINLKKPSKKWRILVGLLLVAAGIFVFVSGVMAEDYKMISARDLKTELSSEKKPVVLDVRSEVEYVN
ncbi:hypothetical protein ACFL0Z_01760, partial [Patescibacteria group bacterium]